MSRRSNSILSDSVSLPLFGAAGRADVLLRLGVRPLERFLTVLSPGSLKVSSGLVGPVATRRVSFLDAVGRFHLDRNSMLGTNWASVCFGAEADTDGNRSILVYVCTGARRARKLCTASCDIRGFHSPVSQRWNVPSCTPIADEASSSVSPSRRRCAVIRSGRVVGSGNGS
jgi:hypothetical protein